MNEDGVAGVWSGVFDVEIRELEIGEIFEGGIIFYLDGSSGGLACAESDQSTDIEWGASIVGTLTAVGTGAANTTAIINEPESGTYAARLCYDLNLNGYTDWFLPSRDELGLMYDNLHLQELGGFGSDYYRSSSENNSKNAWKQNFNN